MVPQCSLVARRAGGQRGQSAACRTCSQDILAWFSTMSLLI